MSVEKVVFGEGNEGGINRVTIDELKTAWEHMSGVGRMDRIHQVQGITYSLERGSGQGYFEATSCLSGSDVRIGDKMLLLPRSDILSLLHVSRKPIEWWDWWFRDCVGVNERTLNNPLNIVTADRGDLTVVRLNSCEAQKNVRSRPPSSDMMIFKVVNGSDEALINYIKDSGFRAIVALQRLVALPQITATPKFGFVGGRGLTPHHEASGVPIENMILTEQLEGRVIVGSEDRAKYDQWCNFFARRR